MHNISMQNLRAGCSLDIGNTDSMAICVLLLQAWIAQPPAAMDACEAILHLQHHFVVKVAADFVLSDQSDDKIQAQQFTRILSRSQRKYLCTGQDVLLPASNDTILISSKSTGASTAGLVTDPQTTLLLPNYRRLCKQVSWTKQRQIYCSFQHNEHVCYAHQANLHVLCYTSTFLCTCLMHKGQKVLHECHCLLYFAQCHSNFAATYCIFVPLQAIANFASVCCTNCITHAGCHSFRVIVANLHMRCGDSSVLLQQVSDWHH